MIFYGVRTEYGVQISPLVRDLFRVPAWYLGSETGATGVQRDDDEIHLYSLDFSFDEIQGVQFFFSSTSSPCNLTHPILRVSHFRSKAPVNSETGINWHNYDRIYAQFLQAKRLDCDDRQ